MKQKTIIQLWGKQGCGKSGTIKILKEELIRHYINSAHTYSLPLPASPDIFDILLCGGLTVGVESMGDDLWSYNLKGNLDKLIGCDIIICASRVYNNVDAYIKDISKTNGYRLLKVTNYRGDEPPFVRHILNQKSAIHLLDLINQIITGAL